MSKINSILVKMLIGILALFSYGFSLTAMAETPQVSDSTPSTRHVVTLTRDRDVACTQCHKDAEQTISTSHNDHDVFNKINKNINCVDCHSNIGPDHRDGGSTVIKYSAAQTEVGTDKKVESHNQILDANKECSDCHTPQKLQEDNWTHDVHADELTCSSCHSLHSSKNSILELNQKQKVGACVACHSDFNQIKAKNEESE
ncbi:cytochrome c nitrite reductase pentaheme subunit [Vibrio sp. SS-MA-C1-2]|uniref:cytochrome c nitrite reductase pentaheme subunit n=1 Tax=Vibrio sp. SS-MA-C1-2 TaxID=2908646 RepID=UPI001F32C436|nr:cytochrome c nitrite reductase pentaheme subunit [Vibrio sp. SS-MA-C1-2]UJF18195.1 cytochrome c nitrite reductase pentaheme subunit [Vibrio sp. SS-MA-C1-2]